MRIIPILLVVALFLAGTAQASNRALLVSIGQFKHYPEAALPGTDIDLKIMQDLAPLLGFTDIEVLQNEQANYANVRTALKRLVGDLREGEQGLFYISSHGAQFKDASGDEKDGRDEGLILYDSHWDQQGVTHVLLDDEMATLLRSLQQGSELLMLVDACHTGSVTKSGRGIVSLDASDYAPAMQGKPKSLGYLAVSSKDLNVVKQEPPAAHYVTLSAARDDEKAVASMAGSYFTLGLRETLLAAREKGRVTPEELREGATAFIRKTAGKSEQFTPQLQGDSALYGRDLQIVRATSHGRLWAGFENLLEQHSHSDMTISTDQGQRIRIGDFYTLEIDLPMAGFLSVIAVDSGSEEAVVLFPNRFIQETRFKRGSISLPPKKAYWGLQALPPASQTLIVALVTPTPLGLYENGIRKNRVNRAVQEVFASLSPRSSLEMQNSMRGTGAVSRIAASKIVLQFHE